MQSSTKTYPPTAAFFYFVQEFTLEAANFFYSIQCKYAVLDNTIHQGASGRWKWRRLAVAAELPDLMRIELLQLLIAGGESKVELSTIIGVITGILAVGVGMIMKGASLKALINPAAFLIILAGTAACLFNAFPMSQLKKFPKLLKILFKKQQMTSKAEVLERFTNMSQMARREGLLALEPMLEEIQDPFLKNGLSMVIDGMDQELVVDVLSLDIQLMEDRHKAGAQIFSQGGTYAPTLGVLGAVVGLIAALGNLNDIEKLGHSISAAFIATLLGIFTGYVLWHPFANKLKLLSKNESELKHMIVEGLMSIQAGESSATIESKLKIFIPLSERSKIGSEVSEGVQEKPA
jgi:chemotaxis protein MotA